MTLFPEEQKDILQKIKNKRRAIEQVIKAPDFIELMKKEFKEVEKWETEEEYCNQESRIIDDEMAKKIRKIEKAPRAQIELTHKALKKEIQSVKQQRTNSQTSVLAKIQEAQRMVGKARLEITGEAKQRVWQSASPSDYWDHKEERGLAILSD